MCSFVTGLPRSGWYFLVPSIYLKISWSYLFKLSSTQLCKCTTISLSLPRVWTSEPLPVAIAHLSLPKFWVLSLLLLVAIVVLVVAVPYDGPADSSSGKGQCHSPGWHWPEPGSDSLLMCPSTTQSVKGTMWAQMGWVTPAPSMGIQWGTVPTLGREKNIRTP